ncbi:MAG: GGDEF domain-containing protein [Thermoleophilia bacterium]
MSIHLHRHMTRVFLIGTAAVLVLTAVGLERVVSDHIVFVAEADAVRVSRGIVATQADVLLSMGPERRLVLDLRDEDAAKLDAAVEGFASPFDILKVKLYSPDARIVYSTDPAIVGAVDKDNERLARALLGHPTSLLESKESVLDLKEETRFSVDVVETYVPIYNVQADVVGAFEIYQDVTRQRGDVGRLFYYALALVATAVVAVAMLAFLILRRRGMEYAAEQAVLRRWVRTDPLTGLDDQRTTHLRAAQECNRMKRRAERESELSLAVLLVEVDGLDDFVPRHGDDAADRITTEVSRRLVAAVRSYDVVGRSDLGRFMVILPETSLPEAAALAERLRLVVAKKPIAGGRGEIRATISLGAAITFGPAPNVEVVLKRAETALEEARAGGGNRAVYVTSDGGSAVVEAQQAVEE